MILRSARRANVLFPLLVLLVVIVLLHRSRLLIGLLFEDGHSDAIPTDSIRANITELPPGTKQLIPKIIHQTYKTKEIPEHWRAGQQAVKDLHPDWEYMFWTDDSAHTFLETHYPSFLSTYDAYPYPIQRADAIRYFILYHFGGIYLDLDLSPYRSLTPLLQFPAFACTTDPSGISNDALGSAPKHPFYKLVIESLETYRRNWGSGYITVMYTTGPLFLSALWIQYLGVEPVDRVRLLIKEGTRGDSYGFFKNVQGGSWHGGDFYKILWMGDHWVFVTVVGFMLGFGTVGAIWFGGRALGRWWDRRRDGDWGRKRCDSGWEEEQGVKERYRDRDSPRKDREGWLE